MAESGECRSCGAAILWTNLNGRPHPVERKQLNIVTEQGTLARGWESHFAHCPNAAQHRKKDNG